MGAGSCNRDISIVPRPKQVEYPDEEISVDIWIRLN